MIKKKDISLLELILMYIWVLLIILDCRSVYTQLYERNLHIILVCVVVSIINVVLSIYIHGGNINKDCFLKIVFISIPLLLFCIIQGKYNVDVYLRLVVVYFCIIIYLLKAKNKLCMITCYTNIMFVIALVSFFLWIIGPVLGVISPSANVLVDWGTVKNFTSYFGLLFIRRNVPESFMGINVYKNIGIFVEPPVYMFCLVLALCADIFLINKKISYKSLVFILTIFSTFSTLGYVLLILVIVSHFYTLNARKMVKIFRFILIPLVLVVVFWGAKSLVLDKLTAIDVSGITHLDDLKAGFLCWINSPVWGHGYETREYVKYMSSFRASNTGLSNGMFYLLDQGGMLIFIPLVGPIFVLCYKVFLGKNLSVCLFLAFFIILWTGVVVPLRLPSLLILAFAFVQLINNDFKWIRGLNRNND